MKNRILVGAMVISLLTTVIVSVIAYQAVSDAKAMNHMMRATLEQAMQQQREQADAAREALERTANNQVKVADEWAYLKVTAVLDKPGQPPAIGTKVNLAGNLFTSNRESISVTIGSDGIAEFGPFRPGRLGISAITPDGLHMRSTDVIAYAGNRKELAIVCPVLDKRTGRIRVKWPGEGLGENIAICINGSRLEDVVDNQRWGYQVPANWYVAPNGDVINVVVDRTTRRRVIDPTSVIGARELPVGRYQYQFRACILKGDPSEDLQVYEAVEWTQSQEPLVVKPDVETTADLGSAAADIKRQLNDIRKNHRLDAGNSQAPQ